LRYQAQSTRWVGFSEMKVSAASMADRSPAR
jgi:hypothetical protein